MSPEQEKVYTLFGPAYAACRNLARAMACLQSDEAPAGMARCMDSIMVSMDELRMRLLEHDGGEPGQPKDEEDG